MPKQEKKPYRTTRVATNTGTKYARTKYQLLGRKSFFGRRVREYFDTRKEAEQQGKKYVAEIRDHGQKATVMSDLQRARAVEAMTLLGDRADLVAAAKYYLEHGPRSNDVRVAEAAELFAGTRGISREMYHRAKGVWRRRVRPSEQTIKNYSDPHRQSVQNRLKRFERTFGAEAVRALATRTADVRQYLESNFKNPRTVENHRATLHAFFRWCIEKGHCLGNPAIRWTEQRNSLRVYDKAHVAGILTPTEFASMLHAAERHDPDMIGYLALGGLSGLRPEELSLIEWADIKDVFLYVRPEISKTGDRAELQILPPLQKWLAIYRRSTGRVSPPRCSARRLTLWRRIHGLDPATMTKAEREKCPKWPHDALRHSFGTYRFKAVGDIGSVCAEMRHESPDVFKKHYVQRGVTAEDAKAYFAVAPLRKQQLRK